jgi:hypothetical protein
VVRPQQARRRPTLGRIPLNKERANHQVDGLERGTAATVTLRFPVFGGGSNSPAISHERPAPALAAVIPDASVEIERLDHLDPDEKAPELVAEHVLDFLSLDRTRRDAIAGCLGSRGSRLLRSA